MSALGIAAIALHTETARADNQRWVHLVPAGQFSGIDGRGPYRLADPEGVIRTSRERAGKVAMVLDYEHQTDHAAKNGQPAPAAGWIMGLQNRKDGIWGLVDFTARAAEHLANREYRYVSPVFHHTHSGQVTCLLRASLTNHPNLDELTALSASELSMDLQAELIGVLGLHAQATAEDIVTATRDLLTSTNSQTPDPSKFVPIGDFERAVKEANGLRQGIAKHQAEEFVERQVRDGALIPALRDWAIQLCTQNKPAFDGFLERTGPAFKAIVTASHTSARPPDFSGPPAEGVAGDVARQLGLDPREFSTHLAKSDAGRI